MPIDASTVFEAFCKSGVKFYTGVPDSALGAFCRYVFERSQNGECDHITAPNEGNAIALAAGNFLATGNVPAVYMQNSGLGNAVNPLMSLVHHKVYSIPMVVIVGHRGKPGQPDEPQHIPMGSITEDLITLMGFGFVRLTNSTNDILTLIRLAVERALERMEPYFLVVEKDSISSQKIIREMEPSQKQLGYYNVINSLTSHLNASDIVFSTTGFISRVTEEVISQSNAKPLHFMNVGAMGHLSSIALGYILSKLPRKESVLILDGDGSSLMHLGGTTGLLKFRESLSGVALCILNNHSHFSVGGQPTSYPEFKFTKLFVGSEGRSLSSPQDLDSLTKAEIFKEHLSFFEIHLENQSEVNPPRPNRSPHEIRMSFRNHLS